MVPLRTLALVDTTIVVPGQYVQISPTQFSISSFRATGRSLSLPLWLLILITGYLPLTRGVRRYRRLGEQRLRGFEVGGDIIRETQSQ